jgi:CubicO group peptidase (beta-lactamase class C family)
MKSSVTRLCLGKRPLGFLLLTVLSAIGLIGLGPTIENGMTRANEKPGFDAGVSPITVIRKDTKPGTLRSLAARVYVCPACGCEAHRNPERTFSEPGACPFCSMPLIQKVGSSRKTKDADAAAELKIFLEGLARQDEFSGAVLLAKHGQIFFSGAYGEANKNFKVPNRIDTKFNLGSMNKMFTAVAIAQLAEAGKLSFDDPLTRFLPNALPGVEAQKIKIKHLLTHTSGLGDYLFTPEMEKLSKAQFRTVDDWMTRLKHERLAFDPGTSSQYSNTGYLILGKIIEQVSGQSYFDYIREHIYVPAGMLNTDSYEVDKVVANLSLGYIRVGTSAATGWRSNLFEDFVKGGPAGGGYSTVEDLFRFALALRSGKLIPRKYVELLMSPKPELNSPNYGYGFEVTGSVVGHGGAAPGISSNLLIYLDEGYVVVVLSNYDFGYFPVIQAVQDLLPIRAVTARSSD